MVTQTLINTWAEVDAAVSGNFSGDVQVQGGLIVLDDIQIGVAVGDVVAGADDFVIRKGDFDAGMTVVFPLAHDVQAQTFALNMSVPGDPFFSQLLFTDGLPGNAKWTWNIGHPEENRPQFELAETRLTLNTELYVGDFHDLIVDSGTIRVSNNGNWEQIVVEGGTTGNSGITIISGSFDGLSKIIFSDGTASGRIEYQHGTSFDRMQFFANNALILTMRTTNGAIVWEDFPMEMKNSLKIEGNVGFYGTTPIAQQTGVAVDLTEIHAALVNLGLITA